MADCGNCKAKEKAIDSVSYIVYESALARAERSVKRLWIAILVLIVFLVGTNGAWLWYESRFEDVVITQENADGYNNYIGNDGDINNGEANN